LGIPPREPLTSFRHYFILWCIYSFFKTTMHSKHQHAQTFMSLVMSSPDKTCHISPKFKFITGSVLLIPSSIILLTVYDVRRHIQIPAGKTTQNVFPSQNMMHTQTHWTYWAKAVDEMEIDWHISMVSRFKPVFIFYFVFYFIFTEVSVFLKKLLK